MNTLPVPLVQPAEEVYHICEKSGQFYLCSYRQEDGETIVKRAEFFSAPPSVYDALIAELEHNPSMSSIKRTGTV